MRWVFDPTFWEDEDEDVYYTEWGWVSSQLIDDYGDLIYLKWGEYSCSAAFLFYLDGMHNIG